MVDQTVPFPVQLSIFSIVMHIINGGCSVTSLVIGFIYLPCEKKMGTWLVVYVIISIICYMLFPVKKAAEGLVAAGRTGRTALCFLLFSLILDV